MPADYTIKDILTQARALLLDPVSGPIVPDPDGLGRTQLADVRLVGRRGDQNGTINWVPGESGWPCAVLSSEGGPKGYKTSGKVTEDWTAYLHIAFDKDTGGTDLWGWAEDWEATLTQWFPRFYRLGLSATGATIGDLYWRYMEPKITVFVLSGVSLFGLVCRLQVHNERLVTWADGPQGVAF